jgi:hypothetical protein
VILAAGVRYMQCKYVVTIQNGNVHESLVYKSDTYL